jgi:hypothetical protein
MREIKMQTSRSSWLKTLHRLDWWVAGMTLVAGVVMLALGMRDAGIWLGAFGVAGLVLAWINPGRFVQRLMERRMFHKRRTR